MGLAREGLVNPEGVNDNTGGFKIGGELPKHGEIICWG
jgi:hypothetical protein